LFECRQSFGAQLLHSEPRGCIHQFWFLKPWLNSSPFTFRYFPKIAKKPSIQLVFDLQASEASDVGSIRISQQNQQLDLVGGCNALKPRDLELWGRFRSPPPFFSSSVRNEHVRRLSELTAPV